MTEIVDFVMQPWPWWFSGVLVGLTVPALYVLTSHWFGISTSFQEMGALCCGRSGLEYLSKFDWRGGLWTLFFAGGIAIGGWIATHYLSHDPVEFLPAAFHSVPGEIKLLVGGFLIGFGARYAGGCTSGHAITGIANLNWPSLVATMFFFVGGLAVTWGLGGWLFGEGVTP